MKLRNIFEEQPSLPGIQNAKIQMTYLPKDKWDWTDYAKDVYNQGGLNALFDFLAKKFKQSAEEIKQDYEGDRAQFTSEIEAVEEYLDIMSKIPLNAEAGGGGGGAGGGGGGAGGGAGAGAGGGASAGAGASSGGDGGSASSSGDSGSAGSGDTGSADSTPSDAPSMDAPVSRGYAFLGSMMPGKKKKKKKKKKTKGFDFGKGVY